MSQERSAKRRQNLKSLFTVSKSVEESAQELMEEVLPAQQEERSTGPSARETEIEMPEALAAVPNPPHEETAKMTEASIKFFLPRAERDRADAFILSNLAPARNLSDLCRQALTEYLDREEPILAEIEKQMDAIRSKQKR